MLVAVLAVMVGRRRVPLGVLVLAVGMMVGRLQVMVGRRVMVQGGLVVMLDGRMYVLLWHDLVPSVVLGRISGHHAPGPLVWPAVERADHVDSRVLTVTVGATLWTSPDRPRPALLTAFAPLTDPPRS
jgi:hypothetical protein